MEAHVSPSPPAAAPSAVLPLRLTGEERLARLVGHGNEAAFTVLYQRFHQPVYRYCRSLVGNDTDAQDALQTTFTRALVALRDGRRDAPLRPWLFRIAHNESISLLRRRRPEQELADDPGSTVPSPHEVAEERARVKQLLSDLGALPERQRGALVMRELSGLSHEEIGHALGISVGAAKQTVLEARRSLQEFSEGRGMRCDEIQQIVSDGDRRALRGRRVRAHLRGCAGCAAFAEAVSTRRRDLLALAPALPPAAASGLLAKITGAGSGHGGGGLGATAGATGKGLGAAMSAKTLTTGAMVLTTAAVGAGTLHHLATEHRGSPAVARAAREAPPGTHAGGWLGLSGASAAAPHPHGASSSAAHHARPARPHATPRRALRSGSGAPTAAAAVTVGASAASRHATRNRASSTGSGHAHNRGGSSTAPGHTQSHGASANAPGHIKRATAQTHGAGTSAPGHTKRATPQTSSARVAAPGHTKFATLQPQSSASSGARGHAGSATSETNGAGQSTTTPTPQTAGAGTASAVTRSGNAAATAGQTTTAPSRGGR
ncbi:MAG TPA: sigma-70 family RNA polymerase sigma factor [Solirubrobacteraceae bacterium]|nr:sigma-70 family RNA polymerase sigma factor [Solirubrobacteraceae bacterium]